MNTFIAQQSLIWILLCLCLILLALQLKNAIKKKKEKQRQDLALAEAKKEEKRMLDLREVLPKLFTGAQLDHLRARHFIFNIMTAEERDTMAQWFETHVEIFGKFDFETIISEEKRPLLSFGEFQALFMVVFNEGYFDANKLPFGGQLEMSQKLKWAQIRLRSSVPSKEAEDEMDRLTKQVRFSLEDLNRVRKLAVAEFEALQKKSLEFDQVLDRSEKAEKERWEMFVDTREFLKDWPEMKKALSLARSEYEEHLKELLGIKKIGIVQILKDIAGHTEDLNKIKKALIDMEKWRKDKESLLENNLSNHLNKMFEQAKDDTALQRKQALDEISKVVHQELDKMGEEIAELRQKFERVPSVVEKKKEEGQFNWSATIYAFFSICLIVFIWRDLSRENDQSMVVLDKIAPVAQENNLLSDSDPEEFITVEENEIPPFYSVNEEEETSYVEEKEYLEKETNFNEEPKLVPVPLIEKKIAKKVLALCQDKKCCLDRFGKDTKTWPQAIECMRSVKK